MRLLSIVIVLFCLSVLPAHAQTGETGSKAGGTFSTSGGRHFWMGVNYRKEWNTPIKAPVIYLSKEHGGLKPVKRGGGKQTKSLRVEDPQGRQYTLRSIQKFITSKTLPGDLQSEAAADLVSDGVSASYPYAALTMAYLSEAAGVPHGNPRVVIIADEPALGEYREDFGNMLALYEERFPDSTKKGYDTDEVADKLKEDNDDRVDQIGMLRVRILDMFVMDLDRHEDQWSWGAYDNANGKGKTYYPIAKDRDQAFYINQGVLPGFVKGRSLVPQLEGFKGKARSISRFNFAARNLDRFFLNQLSEEDWRRTAEEFVSRMTDDVLRKALDLQPAEIREISGTKIVQMLQERRRNIVAEVMEYYTFISETVSITGSDKKELFSITRNDDGSVLVVGNKIDKDGNVSSKMYERKFMPLVTKEVRIYGFDGEDKFVVSGTNDKMRIRVIGGDGSDVFENTSNNSAVRIYDRTDGNNKVTGSFRTKFANDTLVNHYDRLYYKYPYQSFFGTVGFNPDDGLFIGPTFKYIRHGFRKVPYKSFHQFKGLFAFSTKAFNLKYNNEFIGVFGHNTDIITDIEYRGPNGTTNFFGYGVNSVYDKSKPGKFRYYRIRYDLGDIALQLRHRFSNKVTLSIGPNFQFYNMDETDKLNATRNVVENTVASGLNPATVFERQSYIGVKATFTVDTRNSQALPERGVNWVTEFKSFKGLGDHSYEKVSQLNSDFAFYFTLIKDRLIFADRIGGGITMADEGFEFFHAQYLGNEDHLRGYRKFRFAGKSKFYNQAELRLKLANLKTYLFPAAFGIYGFLDAGRVWVKNDQDDKMLTGYGGGIWFSPLRRIVFTLSYAKSKEDGLPLFGMSWKF